MLDSKDRPGRLQGPANEGSFGYDTKKQYLGAIFCPGRNDVQPSSNPKK
jgi:hypothetical protein